MTPHSFPPPFMGRKAFQARYTGDKFIEEGKFWIAPCKQRSVLPLAEAREFARARPRSRRHQQVRAPHSHAAQPARRCRPFGAP